MTAPENQSIMEGFPDVYRARIAPKLADLERERTRMNAEGWSRFAMCVVAGLAVGAVLLRVDVAGQWALFAVVLGGMVGFGFRKRIGRDWGAMLADTIMPPICDHVGDIEYRRDGNTRFPLDRIKELGVVGSHNSRKLTHAVSGTHRDVPFDMVHALLRDTGGDNNKTVFRGLLFVIGAPTPAPCKILIARDYGKWLNGLTGLFRRGGRGMPRVETGHARFEGHLEMHADDAQAALSYLPSGFLDILVNIALSEAQQINALTAAFDRDRFFLALRRSDQFMDYSDLSRSLDNIQGEIKGIFDEITVAHRIIDRLAGDGA